MSEPVSPQQSSSDNPEFDAFKDTYTDDISKDLAFTGQDHDFYTRVKAQYFIDIVRNANLETTPLKILDVGCGHGLIHPHLNRLAPFAMDLHGVDMAGEVIEIAKKANPDVDYKVHDGQTLPYADNTFDVAFTICVMHHVPPEQWESFLADVYRVLKPGGILIIFEHNPLNPVVVRFVNNCPIDENAVLLAPKKIKFLLKATGWSDIVQRFILFTPFDHGFFHRMDRLLQRVPLGAQQYAVAVKPH